jgi:hypothetical protein
MSKEQGDQIGRIFANWAVVHLGSLFKIPEVSQFFCATFSTEKDVCNFDKNGFGYIHFG